METMKHVQAGLFLFAITVSGLTLAKCPESMPVKLLEDCIVYEGAGDSFPTSDYAYMGQYQDWINTQQPPAIPQPTTAATPKIDN